METFDHCPLCNYMDDIVFRVFIEGKRHKCCIRCRELHRAETDAYVNSWQQRKAIPSTRCFLYSKERTEREALYVGLCIRLTWQYDSI
jgi:hypothetical protein